MQARELQPTSRFERLPVRERQTVENSCLSEIASLHRAKATVLVRDPPTV